MIAYLDANQEYFKPGVVCLGFFDGVHLGHQAIIREGKFHAERLNTPLYVHTYDIPPLNVIKQGSLVKEISPLAEKNQLLEQAGADYVVVSHFNDTMMHMSGKDFFLEVLLEQLEAKHLVVGRDHLFGYKGRTNTDELKDLCNDHGIGLSIVSAVTLADGRQISSTAVRNALSIGDLALAETMLGRRVSQALLNKFKQTNNKREELEEQ